MPTIDIRGVSHAYELTNPTQSPHVLVFIHGWLLSRHYWQPLIQRLSVDYQCLSYDLRGFGDSQIYSTQQKSISSYSPTDYVEDLAILLQKLNISSAWLIGHSLGGTIALFGADKIPDIIKAVVCINSGGGVYLKEEFERFRYAGTQIIKFRPSWLPYLPFIEQIYTGTQVATPLSRKWGQQLLFDFVAASYEAALGSLLYSTTESEVNRLPQVVSELKQPVYFIAGAKDTIMEPKYVRHLASFHWMFQGDCKNVLEIPECGHLSILEKTDIVATHIQSLLNK
ncbi:MAG: alpha/beta hydrolase [Okeania sp. SIO3I5]|uniref:alpha/beta fold hydrolase n=1 Tax=Okeania sp. SIO3I5 TaxID=2607805 RepID=UPI0013B8497E|nr:alpha/beta hydrolase [Okeania sp. SIO3I5]NEQ35752.1 alpha/beta hydrolase [Okeania sp. SIO3I5]